MQRTLSSLELPRAVSIASVPSTPVSVGESTSQQYEKRTDVSSSIPQYNGRQRQKGHDPARDISIQVLEKFSLVTKFARETTSQLFRETNNNGFGPSERRNSNQSALDYSHKSSEYKEDVPVQSPVDPDPLEVAVCSLCQLFSLAFTHFSTCTYLFEGIKMEVHIFLQKLLIFMDQLELNIVIINFRGSWLTWYVRESLYLRYRMEILQNFQNDKTDLLTTWCL